MTKEQISILLRGAAAAYSVYRDRNSVISQISKSAKLEIPTEVVKHIPALAEAWDVVKDLAHSLQLPTVHTDAQTSEDALFGRPLADEPPPSGQKEPDP